MRYTARIGEQDYEVEAKDAVEALNKPEKLGHSQPDAVYVGGML
jgi:hypothetical protein